jgi:hypothetical protein
LPRFFALFATSPVRSHFSRRLPRRRYVPSFGFRNRPTSFSAHPLAGLFHPAATSRTHPVQGLLSSRSDPSSSEGAFPHAVGTSRAHLLSQAATRQAPRLRGLHPREVAFTVSPLFTAPRVAPLIEFLLPQALESYGRSQLTCDPPLSTFTDRVFACALTRSARPQRLSA